MESAKDRDKELLASSWGKNAFVGRAVSTVLTAMSLVIVSQRLRIRGVFRRKRPSWSDILVILGWVFNLAGLIGFILSIQEGLGKHIDQIHDHQVNMLLLFEFTNMPTYLISLCLVKASIICQYLEILNRGRRTLRRICIALQLINIAIAVAFIFVFVFQCTPVDGFWHPEKHPRCWKFGTLNFILLPFNVFPDLVILALPFWMFARTQMRRGDKIGLLVVFVLFALTPPLDSATITSLTRIGPLLGLQRYGDIPYYHTPVVIWSRVEVSVYIMCACAPAFRKPLARKWPKQWSPVDSIPSSQDLLGVPKAQSAHSGRVFHESWFGSKNTAGRKGNNPQAVVAEEAGYKYKGISCPQSEAGPSRSPHIEPFFRGYESGARSGSLVDPFYDGEASAHNPNPSFPATFTPRSLPGLRDKTLTDAQLRRISFYESQRDSSNHPSLIRYSTRSRPRPRSDGTAKTLEAIIHSLSNENVSNHQYGSDKGIEMINMARLRSRPSDIGHLQSGYDSYVDRLATKFYQKGRKLSSP
ncbi:hypothetical protein K432DRAFT_443231 [Lepidopterella palustris CBS 459.81]|uniref:Rhodopsin domain-containing protein n=1 Tax=Lepidopterella palustris CBS 459.81 TaxID=1314670 RepID=A0A8E2EA92_9PEZI|nr:hypothetical protein K432DRAFT_443231 [Lepidopterella palustris CBS 459.81]